MQHFWLAVAVLFLGIIIWKSRRPRNFPPGPWAVPILGNFYQIDFRDPVPDLIKLAAKYGTIFSIYLGTTPVIILHGFQTVKDALVNHAIEFSDRPDNPAVKPFTKLRAIITAPYGQAWKEQRRFALSLLRNFGLGKHSMESRILCEAAHVVKAFKNLEGQPFEPNPILNKAVSNIICSILFARRYDYSDDFFQTVIGGIAEINKILGGTWAELYNSIPLIRRLPLPFQKIFQISDIIHGFLNNVLQEHKKTWIQGKPRDFVDYYLEELEKRQNDGSSFDEENMMCLMVDLFVAGSDTTTITLRWSLLLIMAYPDVQARCYREIKEFLVDKEHISYEDRSSMSYVNAVLHEVQRFGNIMPLNSPHALAKDTTFMGYKLKKGTRVMTNLTSVHCDESQWKFPHEFNPANFLTEDGEFMKPEAFMAFSAGLRACLGENLARMELFFFFTTLLRHFEFFWPDKNSVPDLTSVYGIVSSPQPFKVGIKSRII